MTEKQILISWPQTDERKKTSSSHDQNLMTENKSLYPGPKTITEKISTQLRTKSDDRYINPYLLARN